LGVKGGQAATVAYGAALLLALLSLAGFAHALRTANTEAFAAPERVIRKHTKKALVNA
jgi:hypothetical protein